MPGILYHLSFAEEVYRKLSLTTKIDKIRFMAGNLIPDLATEKSNSHYQIEASINSFFIPDMEIVKKELFSQEDELKLGMYCHLFLDYYFIEHYLIPSFIWDLENNKITNPRNNKYWTIDDFFSENGMYGSYTEINQLLLKDGYVSLDTLESIPEILPLTKIDVFDTRRTRTWKEELVEYMKENKSYTGDVFDYEHFCCFVKKIVDKFVDEYK